MKMFFHMQHISSASTVKQLWRLCEDLSADDGKTMLCTVCKKNKLHCLKGGNRGTLCISHNDNWPEDWELAYDIRICKNQYMYWRHKL